MYRPALRPGIQITIAAGDLVVIGSPATETTVSGRLLPLLAPLVDGTRTIAQIARATGGLATVMDVEFGLSLLVDGGWLEPEATRPERRSAVRLIPAASYFDPRLERVAVTSRSAWAPVCVDAGQLWWGPVMTTGSSPCWRCVQARLASNRPLRTAFAGVRAHGSRRQGPRPAPAQLSILRTMLEGGDAATRSTRQRHIAVVDVTTLTSTFHEVIPVPGCSCAPRARTRSPRTGRSAERKLVLADGGYRTVSAEDTLRRYGRHVSPVTGIVRSIEPYFADPHGLVHAFVANHQFIVDRGDADAVRRGFRRNSTGKGISAAQARASALCEALERHSGVYRSSDRGRLATLDAFGGDAIHPNDLLGFSERQFEQRDANNRSHRSETWVPQPFDRTQAIAWTAAWSLTEQRRRFVPTAYCFYGHPRETGREFCRADSNGCAAGNTVQEAILQGFFELVERDAVGVWWYNRVRRPAADVSSIGQPFVRALIDRYAGVGYEMDLLDLTTDFQVPVYAAVARSRKRGKRVIFGFGAHFDPVIAASRAITEANQFLPGALDRTLSNRYGHLIDEPFLNPQGTAGMAGWPSLRSDNLQDDVQQAVDLVRGRGLEMLIVNQTRPDVGLPVVKVIVPGMRPFWPRYGRGRLYTVPVTLGWLPRSTAEEELNPVPLFV